VGGGWQGKRGEGREGGGGGGEGGGDVGGGGGRVWRGTLLTSSSCLGGNGGEE